MFDTAKFGAFISKLRKSADMTQSELGDKLGLTRQAISRYECGDSFPDISILKQLAGIYNMPLELLINSGDPTEGEAEIIEGVVSGKSVTVRDPNDLQNLAPLLKPSVLSKLTDSMSKQGLDMSNIVSLAEYLNDTDTEKLIKQVTFDSIADMDINLLERLLPLLGPYANEMIFSKIIDGELDYHYLELLSGYSYSQVESAVVFGVLDEDALNIIRRSSYNQACCMRNDIVKLFRCPKCGEPLVYFYPHSCKCGYRPEMRQNILTFTESAPLELCSCGFDINILSKRFDNSVQILILGAENIDSVTELSYLDVSGNCRIVVLDSDFDRLDAEQRSIKSKCCSRILFVCDDVRSPHILPDTFDLVIDNTAEHIGDSESMKKRLKRGGCLMRGNEIVCEM